MGIPSAFLEANDRRWHETLENPWLYTIVNYSTLGIAEMIKGAVDPKEPWSFQHFMDIIGVLSLGILAFKGLKALSGAADDAARARSGGAARAGEGAGSKATVDPRKFSEYIFKDGAAPGKDVVFKNLGYSAEDSQMLTNLYQEQAAAKYASGNYTLGKLDSFGQRINIEIELNGIGNAAGKTSYLQSGWMIQADGTITLNTPFSGFTR